ncbi:hypothetical protein [Pleomorphomonas carboxyditropha]|uniref:Uncharacterized protein n=1 Tax=Pleomorphomonas carboxyditropha TaxID=2023338 RepID=A0A2G9WXD9_9HYPH|nr:hypothetical protein [Pleomorphomonas carboxyditropha]PIO99368.1 hypothetical protein CJ014_10980 [Pleomorphomonas carboxyditropha]
MRAVGRIFAALIGFILAVIAAAVFMLAASVGLGPADPADSVWFWGNFGVGAAFAASYLGAMALAPWAVIILVTEVFRLRSVLIYLVAGGFLGALPAFGIAPMMRPLDGDPRRIAILIAAGFIGGFVYWLAAGRMAGVDGVFLTGRRSSKDEP